jgi:hypothetical protein
MTSSTIFEVKRGWQEVFAYAFNLVGMDVCGGGCAVEFMVVE